MPLRSFCALCVFVLSTILPQAGHTHPHIWIDVVTTFQFEAGKVRALKVRWAFDPFFSAGIIGEFDTDKNGTFDAAETEVLRTGAFEATLEDSYFTHVKINGKALRLTRVQSYAAMIQQTTLVMEFVAYLPEPVDPATDKLTVSVLDNTYYVDVAFDKIDPARFAGEQGGFCTFKISKDEKNPIYFNSVYPDLLELICTGG